VDTCAAEFESFTPYLYSTYEDEDEAEPTAHKKIMILGSGPNRIGQGIEFDYCCCHASFALKEAGYETLMVNCNPETVSTDYDTSDRLYFEPLTFENVMSIVARERPDGAIVQFGGQTPLNLARALQAAEVNIIGTSPDSIDLAEDRQRFSRLLAELGIPQPKHGVAWSVAEAVEVAERVGYPVVVRPSYVLGGRAMVIAYDRETVETYVREAEEFVQALPIQVDHFLEDSFELDVDALADGDEVYIGGIMEHIEEAGIHSGDSSCVLPAYQLEERHLETIRDYTRRLARALNVVGLMNVQYAVPSRPEGAGRHGLRAGSEPAGVAHRALREQGDGRAAGQAGGVGDDRGADSRLRTAGERSGEGFLRGEVAGVSVRALPRGGHDSGAGDEVHRGSDGRGDDVRDGVCESAAFGRPAAADGGDCVPERERPRQAGAGADCAGARGAGLQTHRHRRHGDLAGRGGDQGGESFQGQRRAAERGGPAEDAEGAAHRQHAAGGEVVLRRARHPAGGGAAPSAVHHHARGRDGSGERD
jgi:hypothetical protein